MSASTRIANEHRRSRFGRALVAGAAAAAVLGGLPAQAANDVSSGLEGVWQVTRHGVDCQSGQQLSTFQAVTTFMRGGTATGYAVSPGSTPASGSPEYGVWKRAAAPGNYSFRLVSYDYDAGGVFTGSVQISGQLVLASGGGTFSYTANIVFLDAAGNTQFSVCGAATGVRFS